MLTFGPFIAAHIAPALTHGVGPASSSVTPSGSPLPAQAPGSYRDGAEARARPVSWTLRKIVLKSAVPGIVTGLLAATAISISETAPLLLTAGRSLSGPAHQLTNSPVAFLTYPVWTYYAPPYQAQQYLADDAARLLFVLVLIVIIPGRVVVAICRRHAE